MPKITPRSNEQSITVKTKASDAKKTIPTDWWNFQSKKELTDKFLSTVNYLKEQNQFRYRQASIYARLYGNLPLFGFAGSNMSKLATGNDMPMQRPTMSVITSCIDTLVSRLSQARPRPVFLTDNGDYKQRNLAKNLNSFISGEFYQTKMYDLAPMILRDACIFGVGALKILKDQENRVSLERRIFTELLYDVNDAYYGEPRQLFELKLIDRQVLMSKFPKYASLIERAEEGYIDSGSDSSKSCSDQVIVAEGWHLPSGPDANDGLHAIVCTSGVILDDKWESKKFPFVFQHYSKNLVGFSGQGLSEQLLGTQVEINKILMTISTSMNLVGVPRVFIEEGSKVVKAHLNNNVGSIVTYRGVKPSYEVAPCVPAELYEQLQRLVNFAYQQSGISMLSASSQKPSGLTSGTALREYDDIQSDRFASLQRTYETFFVDTAYQVIELAKDIAEDTGSYQTVFPDKNGTKQIDLPDCKLLDNPFVIQAYNSSSLPKDPAGRLQKVTEMMQANLISPQEGRRLLDYPDVDQVDRLANAAEERILKILDQIVDEGTYTPPDPFMDLALATQLVTQYYNLYSQSKLEEEKAQMLRDFFSQLQALQMAAMPPPQLPGGGGMANPQPLPQSDQLPNVKPPGA